MRSAPLRAIASGRSKGLFVAAACLLTCASWLALAAQASPPAQTAPQPPTGERRPSDVVVTGARSDVIASTDRTSFSVANDLQVQNGTLADALRAVPGVEVDLEGRVSLRGDPGVTILIDGRPSALLRGDSRGDALSSMPAGQIDRVEVITNPSAAMSPEGSGGVINLVTKRVRPDARFATVRANIGDRGRGALSVNGAHSGGKLTLTGDVAVRRFTGEQEAELDRVRFNPATGAAITTRQESELDAKMAMGTARIGAEYALSPKSRLTGDLTYRVGRQEIDRFDKSVSDVPGGTFDRTAEMNMKLRSLGGRAGWRQTLPGRGHELSVDLDVETLRQRRRIDGVTDFAAAPASVERISNAIDRTEVDAKADYKRPVGTDGSLNLGYQATVLDAEFDFRGVRGASLDGLAPVPSLTNLFDFGQAVHALYGTYQFDSGKFEAQIGLRAEQVELDIDQRTDGISIDRGYFRLYPTGHLGYALSAAEQLRASYSRRIQRPSAQDLNPYTIYLDPLNLRRGNPFLRPEVTDSIEASWQRRKGPAFYSVTGFYRTARGGVTDVVEDLGNNVFLNTRANLATAKRAGVELVANGRLSKKLTFNASGTLLWNEIDPRQAGVAAKRSGTTGTARASFTWQPTATDFFQLNGNYSGRQLIAQGYREPGGVLNLGYRRKFDDRFSLTVTGQNVLDTARQVTVIDTPLLRDRIEQTGMGPIVMLGLTINLGSQTGRRRPEPAFDFDQGAGPAGG
jgi:outer membrane receptor protein involved in Fe transport